MVQAPLLFPDMPRSVKAYSLSILFVAIAFFLNRTLHAITLAPPFATFLWAVILSAWFAGTGPAILAMLASTILVDYYLFRPLHHLAVAPSDLLRMVAVPGHLFHHHSAGQPRTTPITKAPVHP